jgi:hypothetical protein
LLSAKSVHGYSRTLGTDHPMTEAAVAGSRLDFDFDPPPI